MNTTLCAKCKFPITFCKPHAHDTWEVVRQFSGCATVYIDGKEYHAAPGDIMVIPPNVVHSNTSDEPYIDMYLQAENLDFHSVIFTHDTDDNVLTLMNMLHKILMENESHYSRIADNLTETISSYIKKFSKIEHNYPFVNDLKNLIYDNIGNADFDLSHQIEKSGYNAIYLRRCFKKVIGKPPLEYMTTLRINQAKMLLVQNTFISIKNVAAACGFSDSLYFSTCFKKHTGVSPAKYRKTQIG